jgi:Immunity protein 26
LPRWLRDPADVRARPSLAVPLRDHGFALGVVARANREGVLLGYFFGPRRPAPEALDVAEMRAEHAVLIGRFGHLGIRDGRWPLIGRDRGWERASWPVPVFIRYEELTGRTFQVIYDDADPNRVVCETAVAPGSAEQGPTDGLMGAGFVERRLTALLK